MKSFLYSILKSDIFSHFISLKYLPRWVVLAFDIILCFIAYILSIYIATHLKIHSELILPVSVRFALLIFSQIFFFWLFHTYSGILRYSGFVDAAKLLFAVFSNGILLNIHQFYCRLRIWISDILLHFNPYLQCFGFFLTFFNATDSENCTRCYFG